MGGEERPFDGGVEVRRGGRWIVGSGAGVDPVAGQPEPKGERGAHGGAEGGLHEVPPVDHLVGIGEPAVGEKVLVPRMAGLEALAERESDGPAEESPQAETDGEAVAPDPGQLR